MDKENKDMITPDENAYDPDAAELLKDLNDDDDDFNPEQRYGQRNNSLLNILSSSAKLEAVAAPSKPNVDPVKPLTAYDPVKAAIEAVSESEAAKTVKDMPAVEPTKTVKGMAAIDPIKPPEGIAPHVTKVKIDATSEDAIRIKPPRAEIPKAGGDESTISTPSMVASSLKSKTLPGVPGTEMPSIPPGKRPPGPPPKPSMAAAPRVVTSDNEIILTKDALNEMLPGGKNDEARDLAMLKITDNNWYSNIFNEDYLRTVPKSSPSQTLREARFIIERLGIQSGARVLDLCCGFGRHTIELSAKGFDMVGLDLSMVMLKKALADAQARNQAIKFVHGDMRKLSFKAIFDAIYNVQTSFGYFDDVSNFRVLQGIFNALKPGGVFLIETINRDFLVNDLPLRLWWKGVDCMLLEEIDLEHISGVLKVQRSFVFEDNQRPPVEQKIQIRLYTAIEMRALLMRAGFNVVELSGDYSLPNAYFGATSPKNIFVAEKPIK